MKSTKDKIILLRKKIFYYAYLYYTLDAPLISDYEYDELMKQLQELEQKNKNLLIPIANSSPTNIVGSINHPELKTVTHLTSMLSLDNAFNREDYLKFEKKIYKLSGIINSIELCCELKIDGLALSLLYKQGKLKYAITRGDGKVGENVTVNAMTIKSIPLILNGENIPPVLEIRGEVFMKKYDFIKMNTYAKNYKDKLFSNSRNAAAGSLRQKDSTISAQRNLMFCAYGYNIVNGIEDSTTHLEKLNKIKNWGIPISNHTVLCNSSQEVFSYFNKIKHHRILLDFNIDGIVVKVNSIKIQNLLGNSSRYPRWAIAFKFKSIEKVTKLLNVDFQVGRTGIITPIARLKPIEISGVKISNVSLYNKNEIKKIGLCIGDYVTVSRVGDVIPKIINVISSSHISRSNSKKIIFPKDCPICHSLIIQKSKLGNSYCSGGFKCLAQRQQSLNHFFSKKGFNIKGLGPKMINKLIDFDYISTPVDVFCLKIKQLIILKDVGLHSANNLLKEIDRSRHIKLNQLIYALGIVGIGEVTAKLLSMYFNDIHRIMEVQLWNLKKISGIGPILANNIVMFFNDKRNNKFIKCLLNHIHIIN
ncbi:NAD-dependent DNA ligase LigA [Buchnera aphidicola (Formosaphis micheliae)]|uniref:NAD-dependent DNA ligase LigA n=1 Tax=Buchnera aphidicola TaxID=9 RepID=UPI0031CC6F2A